MQPLVLGAFLLETVPSALYILARHSLEPEVAVLRAVNDTKDNDTKDNDTIAAIVGAAVGALHGRLAFPSQWVHGLLGRTAECDDGRVFELIAQARERWG
jgi:ADP-ribosylglycohydrolase